MFLGYVRDVPNEITDKQSATPHINYVSNKKWEM